MNCARDLIEKHEGCRLVQYQDSNGFWTLGWGHLIDPRAGGVPLDPEFYEPDGSISQATADEILDEDMANATQPLVTNCAPWFQALDPVRQAVVIDMSFQLGWSKFMAFRTFFGLMAAGNFQGAADDLLATALGKEVPVREAENAGMLRTGNWPA